jgi:hypothetical protein
MYAQVFAREGIHIQSIPGWNTELVLENYPEHGYATSVPLGATFTLREPGFYVLSSTSVNVAEGCVVAVTH